MVCYLIDDDEDDRDFFALALEEVDRAIELRTAANAEEALMELQGMQFVPDVIFLDLNMPRIDGWECLKLLRELNHLSNVPVIIYSTSDNSMRMATNPGFREFLTKQSRISELVKRLREVFAKITTD